MSLVLADLLIDVADPGKLLAYKTDPEEFMASYPLSEGDKRALRSGRSGWIKIQAKSNLDELGLHKDHPSVIAAETGMEIEIDLMVEVNSHSQDLIAETDPPDSEPDQSQMVASVVDEHGKLFRLVAA
jgi:hypothetical protein